MPFGIPLTTETVPVVVALAVGASHYVGHALGGEEWAYEDAGVMTAGIVVTFAAFVATYVVLNPGVAGL